jgi:hypothetical protein
LSKKIGHFLCYKKKVLGLICLFCINKHRTLLARSIRTNVQTVRHRVNKLVLVLVPKGEVSHCRRLLLIYVGPPFYRLSSRTHDGVRSHTELCPRSQIPGRLAGPAGTHVHGACSDHRRRFVLVGKNRYRTHRPCCQHHRARAPPCV